MSCNVSPINNPYLSGSPLVREVLNFERMPNPGTLAMERRYQHANEYARLTKVAGLLDPVKMPHNGIRLNLIQPIPIPVAPSATTTVITFICPIGHYGVINYVCNQFTGNFAEGSGEIVWSLGIQEYFYYGYGNITTTLGDLKSMWGVDGGLWFRSNQTVRYFVQNNGAVDAGNVICAIQGWFAPVEKGEFVYGLDNLNR